MIELQFLFGFFIYFFHYGADYRYAQISHAGSETMAGRNRHEDGEDRKDRWRGGDFVAGK